MQFIRARHYTEGPRRGPIELVVIHTMESPEKPDTAEAVARWFAGSTAPMASAHYCIDNNSVVQCVKDSDIAWAAPGGNHNGLQLEHAGRAVQTGSDWNDIYSRTMLARSAKLTAQLCVRHRIPIKWLSVMDLKTGRAGITSHANISAAFHKSSHTDPGPNFPVARYLQLVRVAVEALRPDWYVRALKLEPMWAWFAWRDHGAPKQLRPPQIPVRVPLSWWPRYIRHRGKV